jgi:hypothetical protein
LGLQAATVLETLRANGLLKEETEGEINEDDISGYLNNYQKANEEINLESNTTGNTTTKVTAQSDLIYVAGVIVRECVKCRRWRCKWVC